MQSHYITHKNATIHYRIFGRGEQLLFCFHGYGREGYTFSFLNGYLGNVYTIIAIDFPFHGLTKWEGKYAYKPTQLRDTINEIRTNLGKQHDKINLLGFSMGGRISLHLTQLFKGEVERLVLIAPDGLKFNFWRWLGSDTLIGNWLLAYIINKPGFALWVLNQVYRLKIIPRGLADFVHFYLDDEEQRLLLYNRWTSMRKFRPKLDKIKNIIKKNGIAVRMMFGSFDRVIPAAGGEEFKRGIEAFAKLKVIEAGHNLLSEVHAGAIAQSFKD
ncbi:MAG: alpha/beta hydrolase [Segetibacter sp.]|nr:alpha/beta hydrolase [Segetibacter sp.]